jgi:hypothetical protein
MSKHNKFNRETREEGGQNLAEPENVEQSAEQPAGSAMLEALGAPAELVEAMIEVEEGAETPQSAEPNVQPETPKASMGIGQFVRHMLTKSNKTNAEILELVLKTFEGAKTTAACIAWYKTDLRKKGVLPKGEGRSATKMVEITAEELENMVK